MTIFSIFCSLLTWDWRLPFPRLIGGRIIYIKFCDSPSFVRMYWNCTFNQSNPMNFTSPKWMLGHWGSNCQSHMGAWGKGGHLYHLIKAGHNVHTLNSYTNSKFSIYQCKKLSQENIHSVSITRTLSVTSFERENRNLEARKHCCTFHSYSMYKENLQIDLASFSRDVPRKVDEKCAWL